MLQKIRAYIQQNNMLNSCEKVVAAFSGGADSLCLLIILKELQCEFGYELSAVHVNHGIRGEEADADEDFCINFCKKIGVDLRIVRENVPALAKKWHMSVEEAGRKVRYCAFENALEGKDGKIAVAHHMNDNAETVLFNMIRGTAVSGLVGIRPVNGLIIRPLLGIHRSEIEAFLEERGQQFCIDSTNIKNDYSRNMLRNEVIPMLEQINSASVDNICAMASHMSKVEKFIDSMTGDAINCSVNMKDGVAQIDIDRLREYDEVIQGNVAYKVLCDIAGRKKDIEQIHAEYLLSLMQTGSGKKINLLYGISAVREYNIIYVRKGTASVEYDWELVVLDEKTSSHNQLSQLKMQYPQKKVCTIEIDYDKIKNGLVLRTRQPKDYIVIDKNNAKKTIKKFFIDEKIPLSMRSMPIVFDGNEAVWIVGKRLSSRYAVGENTSTKVKLAVLGADFCFDIQECE